VTIRDTTRGEDRPQTDAAPDTAIKRAPKRKTAKRRAKLVFASDDPGARFECSVDRAAFRPCGSPFRLRKLSAGRHRFQVRAVDSAGNADPTPAKRGWRVVSRRAR
jgi:hypothetical protein